jgi:histidinol-phosphate aminotransferase
MTDRRSWLKQTSLAVAGMAFASRSFSHDRHFAPPDGKIILSSNENPYGPSPMARKAMMDAITGSNRYPWAVTTQLREKIATQFGLAKQHVLIGAGSSEILGLAAQYAALQKGNAVMAEYTFRIWTTAATQAGLSIVRVPLTADKKHDLPAMMAAINDQTKMVYVCNPNNPTGTICDAAVLNDFVTELSKTRLVVVDEAYIEYCDAPTLAGMVSNNKNVLIARTFSKLFGMAGARIGYALAHPDLIQALNKLQPWENAGASAVSLAGALASLDDKEFQVQSKSLNAAARSFTIAELEKLNIRSIPSNTNFLYFSLQQYTKDYTQQLDNANIVGGRAIVEETGKWARITIGTLDEMKAYMRALQ